MSVDAPAGSVIIGTSGVAYFELVQMSREWQ